MSNLGLLFRTISVLAQNGPAKTPLAVMPITADPEHIQGSSPSIKLYDPSFTEQVLLCVQESGDALFYCDYHRPLVRALS